MSPNEIWAFFKEKLNISKAKSSSDISEVSSIKARVAQLVEHDLAKVGVAGSNPVSRSSMLEWWNGRHAGLKILCSLGRAGSSPASSTKP